MSHIFSGKYVEIEPRSSRTKTLYMSHSGHGCKGRKGIERFVLLIVSVSVRILHQRQLITEISVALMLEPLRF